MKQILPFLMLIIFMLSCNSEKNQKNEMTAMEISNTEMKTAEIKGDSSFVDFFEKFMWNREFQKSRVVFPIKLKDNNIKSSEEWRHLPFYTANAYIPTLTSDTLSIFDKDVKLESTIMFTVDFKKEIAESFAFKKVNKNWYLKNSKKTTFANLPDLDFINFLTKFSKDSIFQVKSISFPITESFADSDNDYETATKTIKQEDWEFWKLTDDINQLMILSNVQADNKYRNIFFRGVENGIWVKYTFEKINGNWKLIKIEDYST
ncbi:DUF4348 domain-containing protein [Pararhodonellum marinum]|uniref:DUF4348 domain-containing protein n=1 Tax=Pararhodonellum marinum TaxID=2755358 RepID=UPI001890AD16|nr:DUF4348 domain-containing protein [Pararhodonellum marinum]